MSTIVLFLILGLGSGAVYAALALGLVVTYRSSGVVNLATGAIALYIAYTYAYLRHGAAGRPDPRSQTRPPSLGTGPLGFWPAFADLAGVGGRARRAALRADLPSAARGARRGQGGRLGRGHDRAAGAARDPARLGRGHRRADLPVRTSTRYSAAGCRATGCGSAAIIIAIVDRAGALVPAHPLRPGHPGGGRVGEGRLRHRPLAAAHRAGELGAEHRDRRASAAC